MNDIGFCGDDCSRCPRYIATMNNNPSELKKVADLWIRVGWRDEGTPIEEMICYGCSSVRWCRYDNIRNCARGIGISNCGECANYPCDEIFQVFQKTESYAKQCKETCSKEDYICLTEAFFFKCKKLNEINKKIFNYQRLSRVEKNTKPTVFPVLLLSVTV